MGTEALANAAAVIPRAPRGVARETPAAVALSMLAPQGDFAVRSRTRRASKTHDILLEVGPALEAEVNQSNSAGHSASVRQF